MQNKKSILIISLFFGKLPWYFEYFVHTCKYNNSIDFLIIIDDEYKKPLPANIEILRKDLNDVRLIATQQLNIQVPVELTAYKLCDFRPAFGIIFKKYIKNYDFWGHADIDVIFGDIRNFATDNLLNSYELFFSRHDYISSWFALYKNCEKVNNLFKKSSMYKVVFSTARRFNFDETNFTFCDFSNGLPYNLIKSEVESMTHIVKRFNDQKYIKAYFDLHAIEGCTGKIVWNSGSLIYKNKYELLLYHLLEFKKVFTPKHVYRQIPTIFRFSRQKLYT